MAPIHGATMMPCLVIRLPALPRPAAPRHRPAALRRGASVTPNIQERPLDAVAAAPALKFLRQVGMTPAAAEAALAAAGGTPTAADVEAVCLELVQAAKIPIRRLGAVLTAAPGLLGLPAAEVRGAYERLSQAWPEERKLQRAVLEYPQMLLPSYPSDLRRCMTTLAGVGLSNAQTAAALVRCPRLAGLRRYEVASALAQCGLPSKIEDSTMLELLARAPGVLTPEGAPRLAAVLEGVRKAAGVTPAEAQAIVGRAQAVLDRDAASFREVTELLRDFGLAPAQVAAAAKAWPNLLTRRPERMRMALKYLEEAGIAPERVASYPQVVGRDALRTLGPRLAFARSRGAGVLAAPLRELMNCDDEEFAALVSELAPGPGGDGGGGLTAADFEGFRISWLAGRQVQSESDVEEDDDGSSGSDGDGARAPRARGAAASSEKKKKAPPRYYSPRPPQRPQQGKQRQLLQRLTPQQRAQKQQQKAPAPRDSPDP